MTSLIIDMREKDIIDSLTKKNVEFETSSLEVGDMLLIKDEEKLVFERKTLNDLEASIKDGRYHEQKQRLKSTFPFHRITYIIEGSLKSIDKYVSSKAITSSLISSMYRDGFHVIHTLNVEETVWYLCQIRERMCTDDKTKFDSSNGEYACSIKSKTKKIDNLTPELVYKMQLAQIPGISMKIAEEISKMYPSFSSLLKSIEEQGVKTFDNIDGIGKTKSKKIIEYIK